MTLSEFIKAYRMEHNLSQRQFAERAGLSNAYISLIEKNERKNAPSLQIMKKIASAMDMTVHTLFGSIDDMPVDIGPTVMDYEDAQERLRIILTESEYTMLRAFQAADDRAREDAYKLLEMHRR